MQLYAILLQFCIISGKFVELCNDELKYVERHHGIINHTYTRITRAICYEFDISIYRYVRRLATLASIYGNLHGA
jgi:hypothetical protein